MQNDPELNGKYLGTITKDFAKVSDILSEGSYMMRSRKISDFPIFPVSKSYLPVGEMIISGPDAGLDRSFYVSYLDEFIQAKIIPEENIDLFKASYKDPDDFCCLFVVDDQFTGFLYVPYPED